jgi:endonuclease YncB( thermonuclease family)
VKAATHLVFSECCWFVTSAVFDVHYGIFELLAVALSSLLPDADYPKSWMGYRLGSISEDLSRRFGHRRFLHGLFALVLVTTVLGLPMWWITGSSAPLVAVFVGYGSHLFADMMTLGGVQLFWPSELIAVFPGRSEYRVAPGSGSERAFVVVALAIALLFYPVSRVGFDGLIHRMGGADQVYGKVKKITDGDTVSVEVYGQLQPVRLIGVDTPETVALDQPVGCFGKEATRYTRRTLTGRLVRLEIPRIGDSEDAYGRTLAYVYIDADKDGAYEHLFNEDLIELGFARTTTFSHAHRREFERLREQARSRGVGLWSACPSAEP